LPVSTAARHHNNISLANIVKLAEAVGADPGKLVGGIKC
jgi:hypothetical protein